MSVLELIDSHCHVDADAFDEDREEMLARAREAGVKDMIVVGCCKKLSDAQRTLDFARNREGIFPSLGIHPHDASRFDPSWWPDFCELAARPEVVAIGETGFDFYYKTSTPQEQERAFHAQAELAAELDKALICHIRDAHPEAVKLLQEAPGDRSKTIIHCFTGTPEDAEKYVAMGCYVSFSGVVTFKGKSARPVRESVALVPHDRLLVETDCPYLAPVPLRGKRNEPAFMVETARVVAQEAGLELAQLAEITRQNTQRVFALTSP